MNTHPSLTARLKQAASISQPASPRCDALGRPVPTPQKRLLPHNTTVCCALAGTRSKELRTTAICEQGSNRSLTVAGNELPQQCWCRPIVAAWSTELVTAAQAAVLRWTVDNSSQCSFMPPPAAAQQNATTDTRRSIGRRTRACAIVSVGLGRDGSIQDCHEAACDCVGDACCWAREPGIEGFGRRPRRRLVCSIVNAARGWHDGYTAAGDRCCQRWHMAQRTTSSVAPGG